MSLVRGGISELSAILFVAALLGAGATFLHPRRPSLSFEPPRFIPRLEFSEAVRLAAAASEPGERLPELVIAIADPSLCLPEALGALPSAAISPESFDEGLGDLLDALDRAAPGALVAVACRSSAAKPAEAIAARIRDEAEFERVSLLPLP